MKTSIKDQFAFCLGLVCVVMGTVQVLQSIVYHREKIECQSWICPPS